MKPRQDGGAKGLCASSSFVIGEVLSCEAVCVCKEGETCCKLLVVNWEWIVSVVVCERRCSEMMVTSSFIEELRRRERSNVVEQELHFHFMYFTLPPYTLL